MKKIILIFVFAALISSNISATGINVKKPDGKGKWFTGSKYSIKWSAPSRLPMKANIQLLSRSKALVLKIAQNLDFRGNGSYSWFIPMSFKTGDFMIRVATTNNKLSGTSAVFQIDKLMAVTLPQQVDKVKEPGSQESNMKRMNLPNFNLYKVSTLDDNCIVFNYENLGARYQGELKLWYQFGVNKRQNVISKMVSIGKGQRAVFQTDHALTLYDLSPNHKSAPVSGKIDWDGSKGYIQELNERNNSIYRAVYPELGIPDYDPTAITFVKTGKSSGNPKLPRGYFRVKVKNVWQSCNCRVGLEIGYKFESEPVLGFPRSLPNTPSVKMEIKKNEEKWVNSNEFDWPERTPGVKENIWFRVYVVPGWDAPELNRANNHITKLFDPDGPF